MEVSKGSKIVQSVTLRLKYGEAARSKIPLNRSRRDKEQSLTLSVGDTTIGKLPRLGLETASNGRALSEKEIERLKALKLAHLRVGLKLGNPDWKARLQQAGREASALGVEPAFFITGKTTRDAEAELYSLRKALECGESPVCTWLIFHRDEKSTRGRWIKLARKVLGDFGKEVLFESGTDAYFTELNRERPQLEDLDLICYSVSPEVHAFDNRSLVETLETQAVTVESARQFAEGRRIAVSPITLRPRYNPYATKPEPDVGAEGLRPQEDYRQMSLFAAVWTLGSLKYLGQSSAYSATYYETSGWRGVMELETGAERSASFSSIPGSVFLLYHVLVDVGEWRSAPRDWIEVTGSRLIVDLLPFAVACIDTE